MKIKKLKNAILAFNYFIHQIPLEEFDNSKMQYEFIKRV